MKTKCLCTYVCHAQYYKCLKVGYFLALSKHIYSSEPTCFTCLVEIKQTNKIFCSNWQNIDNLKQTGLELESEVSDGG